MRDLEMVMEGYTGRESRKSCMYAPWIIVQRSYREASSAGLGLLRSLKERGCLRLKVDLCSVSILSVTGMPGC